MLTTNLKNTNMSSNLIKHRACTKYVNNLLFLKWYNSILLEKAKVLGIFTPFYVEVLWEI